MNYFKYKQFIRDLQRISVSRSERNTLRREFLDSIGAPAEDTHTPAPCDMSVSWWHVMVTRPAMAALVIMVGMFSTATSVVYAAEQARPGDFLYPFKLSVNEEVRRFSHSVIYEDTQDFELALLQERLTEAEEYLERESSSERARAQAKQALIAQLERALREEARALPFDEPEEDDSSEEPTPETPTDKQEDTPRASGHTDTQELPFAEVDQEEPTPRATPSSKQETPKQASPQTASPAMPFEDVRGNTPVRTMLEKHQNTLEKLEITAPGQKKKQRGNSKKS